MQHNKAAFCSARKANCIGIGKSRGYDLLFVGHALYRLYPVAQLGGGFKPKLLGSFKHFVCKLLDKLSGFPAENKADLLHGEAVFLLRKLSPAPAAAIAHVVVKAGSVLPNITRKML